MAELSEFGLLELDHTFSFTSIIFIINFVVHHFRYEVGAVILHSPLMSGMRVAFPATRRTWFFDAFPSIDKVPKVTSPVLVIHGTEDEVIDFSHGLTIYEKCPRAVEPLWVEVENLNLPMFTIESNNSFFFFFFSYIFSGSRS